MKLFHVSEQPDIARFDPRPPPVDCTLDETAVWAISEERLHVYVMPRDCPRVCFAAQPGSTDRDIATLIGPTRATSVIAMECAWRERINSTSLYLYELPSGPFRLVDDGAGYWISNEPVTPIGLRLVDDCLAELEARGVEVRFTPSLWPLRDAVASSTLRYSIIRMRNAQPKAS
jgi:hypothetical protein